MKTIYPLGITATVFVLTACSIFSSDIKESNELGEWVVAKTSTIRFKSYSPEETETVPGLESILKRKEDYRLDCLKNPTVYKSDLLGSEVAIIRDCSWPELKLDSDFYYSTDNDWDLKESSERLVLAKSLWAKYPSLDQVVKGVVWRGIRKELGKQEEKINDWNYWCLKPGLPKDDHDGWKRVLEKSFPMKNASSNPDDQMYGRLHERICQYAWNKSG
jgi:hypothetical protein